GTSYANSPELGPQLAAWEGVADWPVILLVDSTAEATESMQEFIWTFFTRFEPAADIHGKDQQVKRFHVGLTAPIVFDCRMKPWYTEVLEVDPITKKLVDSKYASMIPAKFR
ncbi:MAG: 4-hydroxybenzoate decarboxylase, partial [Candidatus Electrothrix sp. MAN1_4]|nr:4-hydroxybenzoate decarboxylase [Candidatus Electrothrix sp. MAN1_4]